jgi:hypothetical protein
MQLRRLVGFVDIGIAIVTLVALVLPPREMFAAAAYKATASEQLALALAEARTMAHPDDGAGIDELAHRLGVAGFKDWAVEAAVRGSARAQRSPTRWRALQAASVAYDHRREVVPALDYVNRALSACEAVDGQRVGLAPACPGWEQVQMRIHQQQLEAGVASGIDPRRGPEAERAFRRAEDSTLRQIHLGGSRDVERGAAPSPGGSAAP